MYSPRPEYARLWTSDMPGVELFQAHLVDYRFGKHFHDSYTIGSNDAGQGYCDYRGERLINYKGRFNLLHPGEVHTGAADGEAGWSFRNLYLSLPLVRQALDQIDKPCSGLPCLRTAEQSDRKLQHAFNQLFQALSQPAPQLVQQSCLLKLVALLFVDCETQVPVGRESDAIATLRHYLDHHYAEDTSIETLANLVGLSPFYLIRSFRQRMGLPPHSYQRQIRLRHAKQALKTEKPLADIALETGFYDQSHLNRVFKQTFAITPGQYRREHGHCH